MNDAAEYEWCVVERSPKHLAWTGVATACSQSFPLVVVHAANLVLVPRKDAEDSAVVVNNKVLDNQLSQH